MTDYFALLGLPRRPGLDETALQESYLRLAARWHPDAPLGDVEKFRDLQEARKTLLDPAARLRHLLALEGADAGSNGKFFPPGDLFRDVAEALDLAKRTIVKVEAVRFGIGRAALAGELLRAVEKLDKAIEQVDARRGDKVRQIAKWDESWPTVDFAFLAEVATELVFLGRWDKGLRESHFRLRNFLSPALQQNSAGKAD